MEDDFDNVDNIANIATYADFLDKFVTDEDRMYLEDEELARDVKELYAVNKGEIRNKADFERKKREIEEMNREEDTKERPLFSLNMNYRKGSFLDQLQERESEVRNGRKSTIIFIGILFTSNPGCFSIYSKSTFIIFLSVLFLKDNLSFGPASTLKKVESLLITFCKVQL